MEVMQKIKSLISPELRWAGVELVDLELKGKPGRFRLCVVADKDAGISIDECANISRRLSLIAELDQLLGRNYQLEVSSPGIERHLKTETDFRMKVGRYLNIAYEDDGVKKEVKGRLFDVLQDGIYLEVASTREFVSYSQITHAIQALPW